jgi:hypothetical protein
VQPEVSGFIAEHERMNFDLDRRLGVIREESRSPDRQIKERKVAKFKMADDEIEDNNVFQVGGLGSTKEPTRLNTEPLEKQKMAIVNTLVGMSDEIRRFSNDIEGKLEKAHK